MMAETYKQTVDFWAEDFHMKPLTSVNVQEISAVGPVTQDDNVKVSLERWRTESADVERHALDPTDDKQRTVFDIMVGVMMGDEDRFKRLERDASAGKIIGDAHAAIEHISGAVAQHHVRGHLPRTPRHGTGGGAEQHQLSALSVLQRSLRLLRGPSRSRCLRNTGFSGSRYDRCRRQTGQQATARKP